MIEEKLLFELRELLPKDLDSNGKDALIEKMSSKIKEEFPTIEKIEAMTIPDVWRLGNHLPIRMTEDEVYTFIFKMVQSFHETLKKSN